jgi:hypothetical protein
LAVSDEAGVVFSDAVRDLLAAEEGRRDAMTARGMSVIMISGTLVTLLAGLAAFATKSRGFPLTGGARVLVTASVITFALSALLAIATYAPHRERGPEVDGLGAVLKETWDEGADFARKKVMATRLLLLKTMQDANDRRAYALLAAVGAQAIAVVLLAVAVAFTV